MESNEHQDTDKKCDCLYCRNNATSSEDKFKVLNKEYLNIIDDLLGKGAGPHQIIDIMCYTIGNVIATMPNNANVSKHKLLGIVVMSICDYIETREKYDVVVDKAVAKLFPTSDEILQFLKTTEPKGKC